MKKLIHRYLTENYRILGNRVYTDKAYSLSSSSFVIELEKVFGLTKKELKWYVKSWIRKQNRNFYFNLWWSPPTYFKPVAWSLRGFGRTIGEDLVSIQPLDHPTGQLFYMDYMFGIDPVNEEFRPRLNMAGRYSSGVVDPNLYSNINVDFNPTDSNPVGEILNFYLQQNYMIGVSSRGVTTTIASDGEI